MNPILLLVFQRIGHVSCVSLELRTSVEFLYSLANTGILVLASEIPFVILQKMPFPIIVQTSRYKTVYVKALAIDQKETGAWIGSPSKIVFGFDVMLKQTINTGLDGRR